MTAVARTPLMADFNSPENAGASPTAVLGALNRAQFLAVRRTPDGFVTRGEATAFIGHSLPATTADRPDGAWVRWSWDGGALTVSNDRCGLVPVYYVLGPDSFALSTSIPRLLEEGASAELDEDALSVFLRSGVFLGEDTPFRAIRALPPGTRYVWRGGASPPCGQMPLGKAATGIGRPEAIAQFTELMQRAVARRADLYDSFAVALSGGMDSRHILLELDRLGRKPRFTFTARAYRGMPSRDVDIAARVSAAVGVPHIVIDHPDDWLALETRRNAETGFCTLEHDWSIPVADRFREDLAAAFDGIGGDVYTDCRSITTDWRLAAFRDGRFRDLAEEFLGDTAAPRQYLAPGLRGQLGWERAVARAAAEFERFAAAPNPPAAFWFWNRTRRTVALAPFGIWQRAFPVLAPYLDEQVFDFMQSLPADLVRDYAFHGDTIRAAFPQVAGIPFFSEANPAPPAGWAGYRQMAGQALGYTLRRAGPDVLSRGYVLSRLGRALVDRAYCRDATWLPPLVVYLSQLGHARQG